MSSMGRLNKEEMRAFILRKTYELSPILFKDDIQSLLQQPVSLGGWILDIFVEIALEIQSESR